MKLTDRYIAQEFARALVLGVAALVLVGTVVAIFERVNVIDKYDPPLSVVVGYFLCRIPQDMVLVIPISMLLTTLLITGAFSRNSEIIAMLAGGISVYRILVPLLMIGMIVSGVVLALNEFVVPVTNRMAEEFNRVMRKKPDRGAMAKIQIWFRGKEQYADLQEDRVYYFNALIPKPAPEKSEIQGITIFELNEHFVPTRRLDAQRAVYTPASPEENRSIQRRWMPKILDRFGGDETESAPQQYGTWTLYQGSVRNIGDPLNRNIVTFQERSDYKIPHTFQDLRRDTKDPEDMNYRELKEYIATLLASGYDVSEYIVDLRAKFSYPFVSFVMVIIGFPFALKSPRSGAAMGVGISIFIGLAYWIILQLGISLGHAGILPPTLAVWIGNIMFASAGLYLILSTRT